MPLLEVSGLNVSIDSTDVLRDVSLQLDAGEILGVAGESGSGKTMTALAIARLLPERSRMSGDVVLAGNSLSGMSEKDYCQIRGREIGIVFQEPMTALNPVMTIGRQVAETIMTHQRVRKKDAMVMAQNALDRVGLPSSRFPLDRYPHSLSGGQRQRVAIAIAIAMTPKLLIADEPTTALDVTTQAEILALFRKLVNEDGIGLILVTHDLAVVAESADRVVVMNGGSIVEQGGITAVFETPGHDYTKKLLSNAGHVPPRSGSRHSGADPILEVSNLVREYAGPRRFFGDSDPVRAVDNLSLKIFPNENVGLIGESGCGKSTLLRTILGLDRPQAGQVKVFGQSFPTAIAATNKELRRRIQVVFQDPFGTFDPRWRVGQLIGESFHLLETSPTAAEAQRLVDEILERVGMSSSDAKRYPHEFSGGQRQRIAIARALVTEPAVIALDEAVSALDVSIRAQILDLLAGLSERLGVSYLFVTHDLTVVRSIADRVLIMKDGRIVEQGPTERVFANPENSYTAALLKAAPDLDRALATRAEEIDA